MKADVWVLRDTKEILVSDLPGPPASICGYVSEEAKKNAEARGMPTVSEIGFPADCYLGSFDLPPTGGWGEAGEVAEKKTKELNYKIKYESIDEIGDDDDSYYEEYHDDLPWDGEDDDYFEDDEEMLEDPTLDPKINPLE